MASLDKAFIKAYGQQGTAAGAIPLDTSGTESLVEALEDRPLREAKKQTAVARHQGVLAALQAERLTALPSVAAPKLPPKPSSAAADRVDEQDAVLEAGNQALPQFLCRRPAAPCPTSSEHAVTHVEADTESSPRASTTSRRLDTAEDTPGAPAPHINTMATGKPAGQCKPAGHAKTAVTSVGSGSPDVQPSGEKTSAAVLGKKLAAAVGESSSERLPAAQNETAPPDARANSFRPLLQVDRIAASPVGERLQQQATAEFDCLAATLLAISGKGRKLVGFASAGSGQGTTTLLGSVALRLAERGVRVAMVDANMADAQLASELGLLPEYGWEKALVESVPLEELVIESIEQPIAFLPLCREVDAADVPDDLTPFREALATFREHYAIVLVDLGVPSDALIGRMLRTLDTVLLVRDMRSSEAERVFDLHRALSRAGVNVAGIIESFVRGG